MIKDCISEERFKPFLVSAGYDPDKALRMYEWNIRISQAFYPILSAAEITLRNKVSARMLEQFGDQWWTDAACHQVVGKETKGILLRAQNKRKEKKGLVTSGCMTSELTFGFWTNMLLPKYQSSLWSDLQLTLPDFPKDKTLKDLEDRARIIREFRNRVFHHEPVMSRDLSLARKNTLEFIGWFSPQKAAWIKPLCTAMAVLREKPK